MAMPNDTASTLDHIRAQTRNGSVHETVDELITEGSVAAAFADAHRDTLRYDHTAGRWHVWTGTHWCRNDTKLAYRWAHELATKLAGAANNAKAILQAGKAAFAAGVEKLAQADPAFAVTSAIWDADPWLLGTPGGTVDLRTGKLRPALRADYITKQTAVAPAATPNCPHWRRFLDQAAAGDNALVGFLRRWSGYTLTGVTREHALLFVFGEGGNGKSVLLNTVARIMGAYAVNAPMDTFTASMGDRHPTDMAMLVGARLVVASEVDEGQVWAEARLKSLTGGDPITARFMRRNFFTYIPQFKLMFSGNHKPALRNVDFAARRRVNLLPFINRPETPDKELSERIKAEWPGILRWMIDGCLEWQRDGLRQPDAVKLATEEYFAAQDIVGRWLAERCTLHADLQSKPGKLSDDCRQWAVANGELAPTSSQFRSVIERTRGLRYVLLDGRQWVRGIGLKPPSPAEEVEASGGDYH
jgi:putative DNA primase/helicase